MTNLVILIGRLTKDIDLKMTSSGDKYCKFTVACNRRKGADGQQQADYIQCSAWRQSADYLSKYACKGTLISVEGSIRTGSYEVNGVKNYTVEVLANNVQILESKGN